MEGHIQANMFHLRPKIAKGSLLNDILSLFFMNKRTLIELFQLLFRQF